MWKGFFGGDLPILRLMVDFEEACWMLVVPKSGHEFERKTHGLSM